MGGRSVDLELAHGATFCTKTEFPFVIVALFSFLASYV